MKLSEELAKRSLTKTELSEMMGVSRKTIQRMGEEVSREVLAVIDEPPYEWLDIPLSIFDGKGRGVPVERDGKRVVMISRGWRNIEGGLDLDQSVVSEADWKLRLNYTCKHGRDGWACKKCLK